MTNQKLDSLANITNAMVANMADYTKTGTKNWDASIALVDLAYQAGGLLKLKMQLDNERHKQGKTKEQLLNDVQLELAEVVSLALFIAHELKLDIKQGFEDMLCVDENRIAERAALLPPHKV